MEHSNSSRQSMDSNLSRAQVHELEQREGRHGRRRTAAHLNSIAEQQASDPRRVSSLPKMEPEQDDANRAAAFSSLMDMFRHSRMQRTGESSTVRHDHKGIYRFEDAEQHYEQRRDLHGSGNIMVADGF